MPASARRQSCLQAFGRQANLEAIMDILAHVSPGTLAAATSSCSLEPIVASSSRNSEKLSGECTVNEGWNTGVFALLTWSAPGYTVGVGSIIVSVTTLVIISNSCYWAILMERQQ